MQGDDHGTDADDGYAEPPHGRHHHSRWRELLPGLLTHQRRKGYRRVAWADENADRHGAPHDEGVLHPDAPTNGRRPPAGAQSKSTFSDGRERVGASASSISG